MSDQKLKMFPVLDLETTGLVVNPGAILEVSMIIYNENYEEVDHFSSVIAHDMKELDPKLSPWAAEHHYKSGLLAQCVDGTNRSDLGVVERVLITMLDRYFGTEKPLLVGNSIHFDRAFIKEYMPALDKRLHYRMIDVSGLWEWAKLFKGAERPNNGTVAHRGLPDVRGSLKLMQQFEDFVNGQTSTPKTS